MTANSNSTAYDEWEGQKARLTLQDDGTYVGWPCRNCGETKRNKQKKCFNCRKATVEKRKAQASLEARIKRLMIPKEKRTEKGKIHYQKYRQTFLALAKAGKVIKKRARCNFKSKEIVDQIVLFYKNCPEGCHVDHIIPLRAKNCCGVHAPWNLQYLTAEENMRKHNAWPTCQRSMQPACFDNLDNGVRV